jgi:hypothetical protein
MTSIYRQQNKFTKALIRLRGACGVQLDRIMGVAVVDGLNKVTTYREYSHMVCAVSSVVGGEDIVNGGGGDDGGAARHLQ